MLHIVHLVSAVQSGNSCRSCFVVVVVVVQAMVDKPIVVGWWVGGGVACHSPYSYFVLFGLLVLPIHFSAPTFKTKRRGVFPHEIVHEIARESAHTIRILYIYGQPFCPVFSYPYCHVLFPAH